jgi:His Kinase A (phospho-acceptor) domain
MELHDLLGDAEFAARTSTRRDAHRESIAFRRLAKVFTESPEIILRNLVEIAVELCDADSAGVSLEENDDPTNPRFRWIAVAGSFEKYLNGTTPRHYSPCGTCLDSSRAQHYRLFQPYYDFLGVEAEPILDGLLIPWENDSMRGTIWAVSHRSREVFDLSDYQLMRGLADFVSLALQQQGHQKILRGEERDFGRTERANEMAHEINNPLQSLTNTLYLARQGGEGAAEHIEQAGKELKRLSEIVNALLHISRVS